MNYINKIGELRNAYTTNTGREAKYICMNYDTYCGLCGYIGMMARQFTFDTPSGTLGTVMGVKILVDWDNKIPDGIMFLLSDGGEI